MENSGKRHGWNTFEIGQNMMMMLILPGRLLLTSFELNHRGVITALTEDEVHEGFLFYGDLRGDQAALSNDGRFMAMCWYEDIFDYNEAGLGSHHSFDSDGDQEEDYWKELSDDEIYWEYATDVGQDRSVTFTHFRDHPPGTTGHFWPCSILSKNDRKEGDDDEDRYFVDFIILYMGRRTIRIRRTIYY